MLLERGDSLLDLAGLEHSRPWQLGLMPTISYLC